MGTLTQEQYEKLIEKLQKLVYRFGLPDVGAAFLIVAKKMHRKCEVKLDGNALIENPVFLRKEQKNE